DGGRHGRVGIFRRGADKDDGPLLDGGQKGIRLRLVEAVALVQKKIGLFSVQFAGVARVLHRLFSVGDPALNGLRFDKLAVRGGSDDVGERGFSASGRAPENTAAQPVQADGAPQETAGSHNVLLADKLVQIVGPHLVRQRLCVVFVVVQI